MSTHSQTADVIASALALSADDQLAVMDAIHRSLVDATIDHGPVEPA